MTEAAAEAQRLYHLVQTASWDRAVQSGQPYFPPTYAQVRCLRNCMGLSASYQLRCERYHLQGTLRRNKRPPEAQRCSNL
jgi:hypothetical protein